MTTDSGTGLMSKTREEKRQRNSIQATYDDEDDDGSEDRCGFLEERHLQKISPSMNNSSCINRIQCQVQRLYCLCPVFRSLPQFSHHLTTGDSHRKQINTLVNEDALYRLSLIHRVYCYLGLIR